MANNKQGNKLITTKENALRDLERELKALDQIEQLVKDQINRLQIEAMDMEAQKRNIDDQVAHSSTTTDPNVLSSTSIIGTDLESHAHVNETDLDLSMAAALGFRNNPNYEEGSDNEDSM